MAINYVQEHEREVSVVELQYDGADVLGSDICIDLREEGCRLHFDAQLQTLKFVDVYDLAKLRLTYEGRPITGARAPEPSLLALYAAFGPSYPGTLDAAAGLYHLNYPGVGFAFPIPALYHAQYASGTEAPVELPDGSVPVAAQLRVFRGKALGAPEQVSLAKVTNRIPQCEHYFEPAVLRVGRGVELPARGQLLLLRAAPQDVIHVLGPPERVFYKTDNKLKIHSSALPKEEDASGGGGGGGELSSSGGANVVAAAPLVSASPASEEDPLDYFFNYPSMGLDVLFDGETHAAVKYVAHSNFPMHDGFHQYSKCNWTVLTEGGGALPCHATWSEDTRLLLGIEQGVKPVVHNRPDRSAPAPHLATYFYGRDGLIVEVMKSNYIETVTLFC